MSEEQNKITVYRVDKNKAIPGWKFDVASPKREWMDSYKHFYRCLPMTIANQNGWVVQSPCDIYAIWFGGTDPKTSMHFWLDAEYNKPENPWVKCHFIGGVITFEFDFIIKTNKKVNMLVRGAPNFYVDNAHPLEGVVETDWLNFSFTMNWKVSQPGKIVAFKKGDRICFIQPIPHNYAETFDFEIDYLENNNDLHEKFTEYNKSRVQFGNERKQGMQNQEWQKHYFEGIDVKTGEQVSQDMHSIKLNLKNPKDQKLPNKNIVEQVPVEAPVRQIPPAPKMDKPESLLTTSTTVVGTPNLKIVK